ncbi:proton-coupled folate transporter [Pieris rapae]|uniref:proton-coupled folate transporter n=1 Tax=Pieris rapae TaxID=64459 RepID=UPI001E27FDBC|nr:proton-coupled folate transporter [Pieris rapae]
MGKPDLIMLDGKPEEKENEETPLNNTQNVVPKRTLLEKFKVMKDNITVEPIMACYIMPSVLASIATQNLNLEKACLVNLNYSTEICEALKARKTENYEYYEKEVQTLIASIQAWKNIIQTAFPVLIILFVGAWSDKTGKRKACILMPIFGEFLTCIGFIINTYFFYELPAEVAALTESIFPALTGGWYTNFIGVFSYICDITTVEERTYRVGIVNLCMSLGYPIGSALSGILLKEIGYYGIFSISGSLYVFSLLYGIFYLEDPKPKKVDKKYSGVVGFIVEFFDFGLVTETFKVAFKKGTGNRRLHVCLLLFVVFVVFGPLQGEYTIMYLFMRLRFNWDEMKFSIWSTYSIVTNLIGTAFSMSLFSSYLKIHDTILGAISCMSKIVASFAYGFARNDLEIYLAPLLEILNGTSFIAMRSIATKLVDGEEFGKVNSLFGLAEAMTPLLYGPLYSQVYIATLHVLPGAVFLLGGFLTLPAIAIFGWLYYEHRKGERRKHMEKALDVEDNRHKTGDSDNLK